MLPGFQNLGRNQAEIVPLRLPLRFLEFYPGLKPSVDDSTLILDPRACRGEQPRYAPQRLERIRCRSRHKTRHHVLCPQRKAPCGPARAYCHGPLRPCPGVISRPPAALPGRAITAPCGPARAYYHAPLRPCPGALSRPPAALPGRTITAPCGPARAYYHGPPPSSVKVATVWWWWKHGHWIEHIPS